MAGRGPSRCWRIERALPAPWAADPIAVVHLMHADACAGPLISAHAIGPAGADGRKGLRAQTGKRLVGCCLAGGEGRGGRDQGCPSKERDSDRSVWFSAE